MNTCGTAASSSGCASDAGHVMRAGTRTEMVAGPAGNIECAVDTPATEPRGVALVAHPHPLYGGTLDNKVVQTLARVFVELGYVAWRPNFRGVGASETRDYAKGRVKALGLAGPGKVRVNQAGCLDRCEEGPCIVVYPDAVWYSYVDRADVDEIIDEHLRHGRIVERLRI